MFVQVAVENTAYSFDKPFTYVVPAALQGGVCPGIRVTVPFGGGNRTRVAMVLSVCNAPEDNRQIKPIAACLDKEPLLSAEMIALAFWMSGRYYCTLFDAIRLMLPAGISYAVGWAYRLTDKTPEHLADEREQAAVRLLSKARAPVSGRRLEEEAGADERVMTALVNAGIVQRLDSARRKIGDATQKMVRLTAAFTGKLSPKQQAVYDTLQDVGQVTVKELSYFTGASPAVIKALTDKGAAEFFEQEVYRRPEYLSVSLEAQGGGSVQLSIEQDRVFDRLVEEFGAAKGGVSLLYGITGSGKTSVFLKLIDYVIGTGKEVILMVPEISLTPQTVNLFRDKFGDDVAVFHSGLSIGERLDEWKRAHRGECKIAVGTRSAVFAPFQNLGLIVLDEEQEHTYKSETSPRYHARDVARFRCNYAKGFCLLSSATPSLESYHLAAAGSYGFNKLEVRFGDATMPQVRLVDMNQETLFGNTTDISFALKRALNDNLREGRQSIVLLNRRGYHTFLRCKDCHTVMTCPNCSISLTYHNANNRLMCHYCGYSAQVATECPECGSDAVTFSGFGTQRAEEALQEAVPGARILRIDADTTSAKFALEKKLDAFAKGDYDIMVGTQMVAKGLNFENVTLVGVLSADQNLLSDDFRSNERTFDLLTQVVGRAGRGKYPGQAIVQTTVPENIYLRLAADQDYFTFYEMEITYRLAMLYPPYVDILMVGFVGEQEDKVRLGSELFLKRLSLTAESDYADIPLRVLRPSPAAVVKIAGKFRYKLIIKCKNTARFRTMMAELLKDFARDREFSSVTAFADPNPQTIL